MIEDLLLMDPPQRKKASDYAKRNSAKNRSSTHNSKRSKNSKNSSGNDSRIRTSSYAVKSRLLPPNFAESVLDLELQIDQGRFTIDTIN